MRSGAEISAVAENCQLRCSARGRRREFEAALQKRARMFELALDRAKASARHKASASESSMWLPRRTANVADDRPKYERWRRSHELRTLKMSPTNGEDLEASPTNGGILEMSPTNGEDLEGSHTKAKVWSWRQKRREC